jgi:hypothetical protein
MLVQKLTDHLKLKVASKRHVRFNPSIVHYKNDIYYMTYRLWVPYTRNANKVTPLQWKHSWASTYDGTVFAILRRLNNGGFMVLHEKLLEVDDHTIIDTRIFKMPRGFGISFNQWTWYPVGSPTPELKKACYGPSTVCTLIGRARLNINPKDVKAYGLVHPCLNHKDVLPVSSRCFTGQREEKNWVWWFNKKNEEMITYFIEPHIVLKHSNKKCTTVGETNKGILAKLKKVYPSLKFSAGTPPIKWSESEYIALGHCKYNYKTTKILNTKNLKGKTMHFNATGCNFGTGVTPTLVYMMFFYTFKNTAPYEITKFSHAFIPPMHGNFLLPFPSGIASIPKTNKYVISYGEGDVEVKLLTLDRPYIEKLLMPFESITPENFKFTFLK